MTNAPELTRLAVVEDDLLMAPLIQDMCRSSGIEVTVYTRGNDLLSEIKSSAYSAILLDLSLQAMNCFELMKLLSGELSVPPVVLMTTQSGPAVTAAVTYAKRLGIGILGCLPKPFSRGELYDALGLPN